MKKLILTSLLFANSITFFGQNTFPETGNAGIGTTTPSHKLDVKTNSSTNVKTYNFGLETTVNTAGGWARSMRIRNENDNKTVTFGGYNGRAYISTGFDITSDQTGYRNAKLMILEDGNVGLGTNVPTEKLEVHDGSIVIQRPENDQGNHGALIFKRDLGQVGKIWFDPEGTENRNLYFSSVDNVADLTIGETGNVGIGESEPDEKLEVNNGNVRVKEGNIMIETTEEDKSVGISLSNGSGVASMKLSSQEDNNVLYIDAGLAPGPSTLTLAGTYVGIGTENPDSKLTVNGKVHCKEVLVDLSIEEFPDYVFQKYYTGTSELKEGYNMPTLAEVEAFTKKNHHLPSVPSAKEISEEGLELKKMTNLLLQKIEELTLYTIEQEKRIQTLEGQLSIKK